MNIHHDLQLQLSNRESAIIDQFNFVTERKPWNQLPNGERINYLRYMIQPLAQVVVSEGQDRKAYLRALHIAAHHGERRQGQGLPDSILFEDLSFFRWAVCSQIPLEEEFDYLDTISRIDKLLTLASAAALRGYHRDVFEARGEWPDVLEMLISETESGGGVGPKPDLGKGAACGEGWVEMGALAETFVADARRWLSAVGHTPEDRVAGQLVGSVLSEYAGALDLLEVLQGEIVPVSGRAATDPQALVITAGTTVEFANHVAVRSLGYPAYELRGRHLIELVHPHDRAAFEATLERLRKPGESPALTRIRIRHPEGSWISLDLTIRPLLLGDDSRRFLLRGRIGGISVAESPEPGRKGQFFKRTYPRKSEEGRQGPLEAR